MCDRIPHDCPICGLMMRDMNDILSFEEFECCTECQDHFVYRNLQGWMSGSRPSEEDIQTFRETLRERVAYLVTRI